MLSLISPIGNVLFTSRAWRLVAVLGLAVSATLVLNGPASAIPPNPCDFFGW
jgi:hypothetical protein